MVSKPDLWSRKQPVTSLPSVFHLQVHFLFGSGILIFLFVAAVLFVLFPPLRLPWLFPSPAALSAVVSIKFSLFPLSVSLPLKPQFSSLFSKPYLVIVSLWCFDTAFNDFNFILATVNFVFEHCCDIFYWRQEIPFCPMPLRVLLKKLLFI